MAIGMAHLNMEFYLLAQVHVQPASMVHVVCSLPFTACILTKKCSSTKSRLSTVSEQRY